MKNLREKCGVQCARQGSTTPTNSERKTQKKRTVLGKKTDYPGNLISSLGRGDRGGGGRGQNLKAQKVEFKRLGENNCAGLLESKSLTIPYKPTSKLFLTLRD